MEGSEREGSRLHGLEADRAENLAAIAYVGPLDDCAGAVLDLLRKSGHAVRTYRDVEGVLDDFAASVPLVALLAAGKGDAEAYAACRRLTSDPHAQGIAVLLLYASGLPCARGEAYEAGAADLLEVPCSAAELSAKIRTHLEASSYRRESAARSRSTPDLPLAGTLGLSAEAFYQSLLRHTLVGVVVADAQQVLVAANDAFSRMVEYDERELVGRRNVADLTHPDDRSRSVEQLRRLRQREIDHFVAEKRYVTKTGRVLDAITVVNAVFDAAGQYLASTATVLDVTELKRSEEALRLAEFSIEHSGLPTFWLDRQARVVRVNEAACHALGYRREELVGSSVWDFDPDYPTLAEWEAAWERIRTTPDPIVIETRHRRRDGTLFPVEVTGSYCEFGGQELVFSFARDISERRRTDAALRESEELFRLLFEKSGDANLLIDGDRFVDCNETTCRQLGATSKRQVLLRHPWEISPEFQPDGRASVEKAQALLATCQREGCIRFEWVHRRFDGADFWAEVMLTVVPWHGGSMIHTAWRDITERKRAQLALQVSEERMRGLVENAVVGIFETRPDGGLVAANEAMARMFGFETPQQITSEVTNVGEQLYADPEDRRRILQTLTRDGVLPPCEVAARRRDGSDFWILLTARAVRASDGSVLLFQGTTTDVTERHSAEAELRKEREFSRLVLDASPAFFVAISAEGKTLMMNRAMREALGYAEEEIRGTDYLTTFVPESDRPALTQVVRSIVEERQGTTNENLVRCRSGETRLVEWHGRPMVGVAGIVEFFVGVGIDITERRRVEEEKKRLHTQLVQAQKMEAVGRLAGGVAHDFNNMLSVILGFASIAREQLTPNDPLASSLEEILKAANRSADLTRQLLAFSRRQIVAPSVLNLNRVVEDSEKMLQRLVGEDVDVRVVEDSELWTVVLDRSQIDQVLANLTVNARDAMPEGGVLTIETANVVLPGMASTEADFVPGDYVRLTVQDTGLGMGPEQLLHVFEPFYTTKLPGKGTGLGLSIVYGIVRQNGGVIQVDSTPGVGTSFRIYLPRCEGQARAEVEDEQTPRKSGGETILVVEDDEQILRLCREYLERRGHRVLTARHPGEALLLCEQTQGPIDLLVTDVVLPAINGRELGARLALMKPGIRVLYMSGYTADVITHHGILAEGVNYLQKPFMHDAFYRKVRQVLDQG